MGEFSIDRRTMLRGVVGAGAAAAFPSAEAAAQAAEETDPTTRATYRAVVDAVVPRTESLADDLGSEHVPGGLDIGLDAYLIEFVNTLFTVGNSALGDLGNARLAEFVARSCDVAAAELLARGENEEPPAPTRFEGGGPFASLSRMDRLRALALLDEKEFDTAVLPGPVAEGTARLIPQLLVAFTQVIYYSEWEGYEDFSAPPSEREFSGDDIQSWEQTDFPGVIDGAAAFRGYWGGPDASLGAGRVWKTYAGGRGPPRKLYFEPGEFTDGDYDTAGYEEPFDTGSDPADGHSGGESEVKRPEDAAEAVREGVDEGLLERATERFFGRAGGGRW